MIKKQVYAQITKATSLGDGEIEGVVATSNLDREGEKLDLKGLDIKTFMQTGGPVLLGHDYRKLPIGKALSLRKKGDELISKFKLAIDISPLASQVYELILGDFVNALSIGFIGKEWDEETRTWVKAEMLEFSVVPVPANSEALITAKSKGLKTNEFESYTKDNKENKEIEADIQFENLSEQVSALSKQISALEAVVASLDTDKSTDKVVKRKLVLVTAKKNAQIIDKQVELVISSLKKSLSIGTDNQ